MFKGKKLVLVLATFLLVTETNKEVTLEWMPCIHYLLCFWKDIVDIRALINSGSEVNIMALAYASKLGFKVYSIDVGAQKVDGSILKIVGMVLASFQIEDKLGRAQFFLKTFLLANINVEVVLDMLFLTFNNTDVQFIEKELIWRFYIIVKALPTIK